jgi:hypothetical protein
VESGISDVIVFLSLLHHVFKIIMTYGLPIQFQFGSTIRCRFTFLTETELKFSSGFFHFQSDSTIRIGLRDNSR